MNLKFSFFILDSSNPEQRDASKDNIDDIMELPSACNQLTQTEDILDFTKEVSKEDVFEEQGTTLPKHSQNETEGWLFTLFDSYLFHNV